MNIHEMDERFHPATIRDTKIGKLPEHWADHGQHKDLSEYLRSVRQQTD